MIVRKTFFDGLKIIFSAVRERVEMVTDELKGRKREDAGSEDEDESDED